jgi:hypothetical protein
LTVIEQLVSLKQGVVGQKPMNRKIDYFLFIFIGLALIGGCQGGGGSGSPTLESSYGWQVTLKISVPDGSADGGAAYNRLIAGTGKSATDAFDHGWDIHAFLAGPVQAYFVYNDDTGSSQNAELLWQDIRGDSLPEDWDIEVMADPGKEVTISWVLPMGEVSCLTHEFTLEDSDGPSGQTDMCITPSITYQGDGQIRHFVLTVS